MEEREEWYRRCLKLYLFIIIIIYFWKVAGNTCFRRVSPSVANTPCLSILVSSCLTFTTVFNYLYFVATLQV